jgi:cytidylate kinase
MSIVSIYEGVSGAEEAAGKVAKSLGYRLVGREELVETVEHYGVPRAKLAEITEKEPHWWEQWLQNLRPYRIALRASMCELARDGNIVYHGHVGHELLPGIAHVLKVLLTASLEFRVTQLRSRLQLDEGTARKQIEHRDKADSRRLMALFGNDWKDSSCYDMILNLAIGTEAASTVISTAAKLKTFDETPASKQAFEDLALASTAHARLLGSRQYHNLPIDLKADSGKVVVSGVVPLTVSDGEIVKILKGVPGVSQVTMNLFHIPERRLDTDW